MADDIIQNILWDQMGTDGTDGTKGEESYRCASRLKWEYIYFSKLEHKLY